MARPSYKKPDSRGTAHFVPVSNVWETDLKTELIFFFYSEYLNLFWLETPWLFSDNVFKYTSPLTRDKIIHMFNCSNTHSHIWENVDFFFFYQVHNRQIDVHDTTLLWCRFENLFLVKCKRKIFFYRFPNCCWNPSKTIVIFPSSYLPLSSKHLALPQLIFFILIRIIIDFPM